MESVSDERGLRQPRRQRSRGGSCGKIGRTKTAEADRGRHPGFPRFNVVAGGPGSLAWTFGRKVASCRGVSSNQLLLNPVPPVFWWLVRSVATPVFPGILIGDLYKTQAIMHLATL